MRWGRLRGPSARRSMAACVVALLLTACGISGYAFRIDESIDIVAPPDRSTVTLPIVLRWTDERPPPDVRVSLTDPDAEYYAVFVDRTPIPPDEQLISVLDDSCRQTEACVNEESFRDIDVYLTAEPSVELEFLDDRRPTSRRSGKDPHEATIVRIKDGRRIGEAAFRIDFFVQR